MAQPVVHFEIIGKDPMRLRSYYGDLFGWDFITPSPVARLRRRSARQQPHAGGADAYDDAEG